MFQQAIDRLASASAHTASMLVSTTTWREQFQEAIHIGECMATNKNNTLYHPKFCFLEDEKEERPGLSVYCLHFVSLPWKVIAALIPPTGIYLLIDCFEHLVETPV